MKGKKHQSLFLTRKKIETTYPTEVRTPAIKFKVPSHVLKENPPPPKNKSKIFKYLYRNCKQNFKI